MEAILPFATVIGPILLLAVIVYVWMRNRNPSAADEAKADRGARELRREMEEEQDRTADL